jgi:hypothetical protein
MDNHSLLLLASFITQIKANGVAAFVINKMQKSEHPLFSWITVHTPWVTRGVSALFASLAALGVHATYHAAEQGGALVITGLSATVIVSGVWQIAQNYAIQHAWGKVIEDQIIPAFTGVGNAAVGPGFAGAAAPQPGGATKP